MKTLLGGTGCAALLVALAAAEVHDHAEHDCDDPHHHHHHAHAEEADAFGPFQKWQLGDFLFAGVHIQASSGWVDGKAGELNNAAHDPPRAAFSMQAIEPTLLLRTEHAEAFGNLVVAQDGDGGWDAELEELHASAEFAGVSLKGGQFLARNGIYNNLHGHDLDFVNAPLTGPEFLGEHGLLTRGAELSWSPPFAVPLTFSTGFGRAVSHDHHGHSGSHPHDDDEEEDHDDDEHHDPDEGRHESGFAGNVWNMRVSGAWKAGAEDRFIAGSSLATGGNGFGRDTTVAGADFTWNHGTPGSGGWSWRNELMWRQVGTDAGRGHEWGAGSEMMVYAPGRWDYGLRCGWFEGLPEAGLDSRFRVSPVVTRWLDAGRRIGVRAQYDFDRLGGGEVDHSLWFQLQISLGSREEPR